MTKIETTIQRINRLATMYTDGTRNINYKELLVNELEALVLQAKLEQLEK